MVHGYLHLCAFGMQCDEAHVILRSRRARIMANDEAVQLECEGQGTCSLPLGVLVCGNSLAQMKCSAVAADRGDQSAQQDDQKSHMQAEDAQRASPQAYLIYKMESRNGSSKPQQAKPSGAIHHGMSHGGALQSFHQSGKGYGHSSQAHEQERCCFKNPGIQRCLSSLQPYTPSL